MNTAPLRCPNCMTPMERRTDPEMTVEACPKCGGLFLDRGELNQLATGLSGDIEFCSLDVGQSLTDKFPPRQCPRCPGRTMKKEDLLIYSGLLFDHCEQCGGWFLDRGELPKMNRFLAHLRTSQGGAQDSRSRRGDHWVTITRTTEVHANSVGGITPAMGVPVNWTRVAVYFRNPLGSGLRITPETWAKRFWKLFGSQDIRVGDAEFDSAFLVKADDPEAAKSALGDRARKELLDFARSPSARLGYKRAWQVLDDRVEFSFTDWGHTNRRPSEAEQENLIGALVKVSDALVPIRPAK
jgi:Zn-finger nucleic acid-binding protein